MKKQQIAAKSGFSPVFMLIGATLFIVFVAALFLKGAQKLIPTPPVASQNQETPTIDTAAWKTYTDPNAGFSLKYPSTVLFNEDSKGATKLALNVATEKLSNIPEDLPQLMGRNDAIAEKDRLAKGTGENIAKIGNLNAQESTVLSQFEVCSVLFTRRLTFYPGEYRVILTLSAPKDAVIAAMPEFFTTDKANCGDQKIWDQKNPNNFEKTLINKQGKGIGQEWYDTFGAIVKTITF